MLNKKAQGMSTSTIILLILRIVILVILILGFTLGWDKIAPWMQEKQQFSITKEVCLQQEVEEIEYNKTEIICALWTDRSNVSDYEYLHYGIPRLRQENIIEIVNISKKDITKEWLDKNENCNCTGVNKPCSDLLCSNGGGECLKYKCFDKYTIEVLQ